MKEVRVGDEIVKVPKRYQDKVKAEKKIKALRAKLEGKKPEVSKKRKFELTIPVETLEHNKKTIYYVRESRIFKDKWVNMLGGLKQVKLYVENYKNEIKNKI